MNKSPLQWSLALKSLALESEDMVVSLQLTNDQLQELSIMMETLSLYVKIDDIRTIVEMRKESLDSLRALQ